MSITGVIHRRVQIVNIGALACSMESELDQLISFEALSMERTEEFINSEVLITQTLQTS